MKTQKVAVTLTILAVVFLSIGVVSAALSASDATITSQLSNTAPKPGNGVTVSVTFQSHVSQELQIYRYGIHADWMASWQTIFKDLTFKRLPLPLKLTANISGSFLIVIPTTASIGSHTYYVGVDGVDASGNTFSLNSAEATVQVVARNQHSQQQVQAAAEDKQSFTRLGTISNHRRSRGNRSCISLYSVETK